MSDNLTGLKITEVLTAVDGSSVITLDDGSQHHVSAGYSPAPAIGQEYVIDASGNAGIVTLQAAATFDMPVPVPVAIVSFTEAFAALTGSTITSLVSGKGYDANATDDATITFGELRGGWTVATA